METIEIFFDDLSQEKQNEILEAFDIQSPDEMNWDTIPITFIACEK